MWERAEPKGPWAYLGGLDNVGWVMGLSFYYKVDNFFFFFLQNLLFNH